MKGTNHEQIKQINKTDFCMCDGVCVPSGVNSSESFASALWPGNVEYGPLTRHARTLSTTKCQKLSLGRRGIFPSWRRRGISCMPRAAPHVEKVGGCVPSSSSDNRSLSWISSFPLFFLSFLIWGTEEMVRSKMGVVYGRGNFGLDSKLGGLKMPFRVTSWAGWDALDFLELSPN